MKLGFLELPPTERSLYIEQAAIRRNLSPVVIDGKRPPFSTPNTTDPLTSPHPTDSLATTPM
jgi:hypothetical protein